jgi:hypothetical protein
MTPRLLALLPAALMGAGAVAEAATLRANRARPLVPLDEIIPGGPPPDGSPAIDRPVFVAPADAFWFAWSAFNPTTTIYEGR